MKNILTHGVDFGINNHNTAYTIQQVYYISVNVSVFSYFLVFICVYYTKYILTANRTNRSFIINVKLFLFNTG